MPANITTNATSSAGATVNYTSPTAVDEAGDSPAATVSCSPASGSTFPIGTTTVTCTATSGDDTPSTASKTFTVTVNDTDLGLTGVSANKTVNATSSHGAVVTYASPSAVDEAGDSPAATVGCTKASGSTFAIGTTTVTCTATDSDDTNSPVSASFTVTVRYGVKLLYKAPMTGKVGSNVPIKIELVNAAGQNVSSSSVTVQALCVVLQGATTCSGAPIIYANPNQFFTFMSGLDTGGGYQFNVKTTTLTTGKTYQLLFRVAGEDSSSYHADANATFTLTK
jgi:hypothetical protein